jgi:BirA family transcriptional regulator, biotin operon repressor / biotin---[acetyl-CoA-carboxylase] ligase
MTEFLDQKIILKGLEGSLFSGNFIFQNKIDSTNNLAKKLALKGAPHGTLVLAEEQTAGKGRLDRKWLSPGNENLIFTILLRPPLSADNIFPLTMILAVSAIDAIEAMTGLNVLIKWPNDLYVNRKKLAGILTEFSVRDFSVEYVIIGLGLNVNWMPGEKDGILYPATSILAESCMRISRNELLTGILTRFEISYGKLIRGGVDELHTRWNELSLIIGMDVDVTSIGEVIKGRVKAIDREGALILENSTGEETRILSGDVSLRF